MNGGSVQLPRLDVVIGNNFGHLPMFVGVEKGLFRKHGLDVRDVGPSVSFFSGVHVDSTGALEYTGSAGPGTAVDLLVHLPVVVVLGNAAHPLNPAPNVTPLDVLAWRAGQELTTPVNADPEYLRALFNTESAWAAAQNHGDPK